MGQVGRPLSGLLFSLCRPPEACPLQVLSPAGPQTEGLSVLPPFPPPRAHPFPLAPPCPPLAWREGIPPPAPADLAVACPALALPRPLTLLRSHSGSFLMEAAPPCL